MKLTKAHIFLITCLAFNFGVGLGLSVSVWIFVASAGMVFLCLLILRSQWLAVVALALVVAGTGNWWFKQSLNPSEVPRYYEQQVQLQGTIIEEPDERLDKTYLTIGRMQIHDSQIEGKILVTVEKFPVHEYGSVLAIDGLIREPNDGTDSDFSYKNYLSRFGIEGVMYYPAVEQIQLGKGNAIKFYVLKLKDKFSDRLNQLLPEPESSFLAGILIGARRAIPEQLLEDLNTTGTTHLIAISGFNITIIANNLGRAFNRFGRRLALVLTLAGIALFVVLTGASASVTRAGIMGSLGLLATSVGRMSMVTNALVLTGTAMIVINPKILHFDAGFQLSFLALCGLVYLVPIFESKFPNADWFVKTFFMPTMAAQILTLPLILHSFGRLSWISPLTNVIVVPLIPLAMLVGFLAGAVAIVSVLLAAPVAWVSWLILHLVVTVIEQSARLPFAATEIRLSGILTIVSYAALGLYLLKHHQPQIFKKIQWKKPQND